MKINLVPELLKAWCSIVGAWGPASENGDLFQLRALDWDPQAPISKYPNIIVYQSSEPGSNVYANIGYAGCIFILTGFSTKLGISEKIWDYNPYEIRDRFGEPWGYVLKRVLQFGNDLDSAIKIMQEAHRTCLINVGVGSATDNQLKGMYYS